MSDYELQKNNVAIIIGKIKSEFLLSHDILGERFFTTDVVVKRTSGATDTIPVVISERLVDVAQDHVGKYIEIHGQFRSRNEPHESRTRLVLYVFARDAKFIEEVKDDTPVNQIFLDGYICKPPVYRETPLGREIADLHLAVNRPYGKSDYIPCILWGRNARYVSSLRVGTRIAIHGRVQSRVYYKHLGDGSIKERTAYEVSVYKLEDSAE